jgi:hypothetical protein
LGILDGADRARFVSHLEVCEACQEEVHAYGDALDRLVAATPPVEPPLGFEGRVEARLAAAGASPPAPGRRGAGAWRRPLAWIATGAAAAVIVLVSLGFALWPRHQSGPSWAAASRTGTFDAPDGHPVGEAFLVNGRHPWMYMTVSIDGYDGSYRCRVVLRDGRVVDLGSFSSTGGHASWGGSLPVDPATVARAEMVFLNGEVVATATIT